MARRALGRRRRSPGGRRGAVRAGGERGRVGREQGDEGSQLYLEAEAHGWRGTGIGCFFDDAVHDILGLDDDRYQVVYHFSVGVPVDDPRLLTRPAYE